jgi:hypothetical protein
MIQHKEFLNRTISNFPELREEISDEDYADNITLQVDVLLRFTQDGINRNDVSVIKRTFDFVAEIIGMTEHKVSNSLYLSFLRKLDFSKNSQAKKLLASNLKKALRQIKEYDNETRNDQKLMDFLASLE